MYKNKSNKWKQTQGAQMQKQNLKFRVLHIKLNCERTHIHTQKSQLMNK